MQCLYLIWLRLCWWRNCTSDHPFSFDWFRAVCMLVSVSMFCHNAVAVWPSSRYKASMSFADWIFFLSAAFTCFVAITFPFFGGLLGFFGGFAFAPTTYFVSAWTNFSDYLIHSNRNLAVRVFWKLMSLYHLTAPLRHVVGYLQAEKIQLILDYQLGEFVFLTGNRKDSTPYSSSCATMQQLELWLVAMTS